PGGAGAPHGDLRRLAHLGDDGAACDHGASRDTNARPLPEPRVHGRRLPHGAARRECAYPGRQPRNPPRADHDSRSHAARVLGAASGTHGVGIGTQAIQLRLHRLRALHPLGCLHPWQRAGGAARVDPAPGTEARRRRGAPRCDRDGLGKTARVQGTGVPCHRVPLRGVGTPGASAVGSLSMAGVPLDIQLLNLCAALLLLLSFAMLSQRRIVNLVNLLALQGTVLFIATLLIAWRTRQPHLYLSAVLTLGLKVMLLPYLRHRLIRRLEVYWDAEPLLNIPGTMLIGVLIVVFSFGVAQPISALASTATRNAIGIAVAVVLLSFLTMITRRKAMSQVVGFLSMENGLFFGAMSATYGMPMVVEFGVALDVLVAVLVLGIFFFQIREQFDSLDLHHLESLREDTLSRGRE